MVTKIKLKCKFCDREIAHLFLYERKNEQLGFIPECSVYCRRCKKISELVMVGQTKEYDDELDIAEELETRRSLRHD